MKTLTCWLLLVATAAADEIAVLLPDAPKSYIVTVDALGGVTVSPLKAVTRPGPQPTPTPTPTPQPDPNPQVLTERAKAIKALAEKATADSDRANTAKGLAELYRQIAKLIDNGTIKDVQSLSQALTLGADNFLASRGNPPGTAAPAWVPVRVQLSTELTKLQARTAPLSEYAVLLGEAASGLDASAPQKAIDPHVLALIMQIIQLIISMLNK